MSLIIVEEQLIPALIALFPNNMKPDLYDKIWFQQDDLPPHYAQNVRHYLIFSKTDGLIRGVLWNDQQDRQNVTC